VAAAEAMRKKAHRPGVSAEVGHQWADEKATLKVGRMNCSMLNVADVMRRRPEAPAVCVKTKDKRVHRIVAASSKCG
jgi:hypothetical protein